MPNVSGDAWARTIDDGVLVPALVSSRIGMVTLRRGYNGGTYETGFRACSER
jgi:hypothetical protein